MTRKINDTATEEIIEMGITGQFTVGDIATEVGVSTSTVRNVLKGAGIEILRIKAVDRVSEEVRDKLIEAYTQNQPVSYILNTHQISYNTFYEILAIRGVEVRIYEKRSSPAAQRLREDAVLILYAQGEPIWFIQQETGLYQTQIHSILHKHNVPLRSSGRPAKRLVMPPTSRQET